MAALTVEWQGREYAVELAENAILRDVGSAIAVVTHTSFETLKLLQGGRVIIPSASPQRLADETGLRPGVRVRLMASSERDVAAVRSSRDLPGLAGFEHEARRTASRRRTASSSGAAPPSGTYTFERYEAWEDPPPGAFPSPAQALKLLHRLAGDRGIVGIMQKHRWRAGLLSEMPPEGKVGISPVCVLGVNINAGQEISLRLRTDDLKGFRRYDRIRETLVHELAHMVWGEHDNNFKQLNSQLLKSCTQLDWTAQPGHTTGGFAASDDEDLAAELAQQSTAYRLGGGSSGRASAPPTAAAAAAALQRFSGAQARAAAAAEAASAFAAGPATSPNDGGPIAGIGHRDGSTEAAEAAMRRLGDVAEPLKDGSQEAGSAGTAEEQHGQQDEPSAAAARRDGPAPELPVAGPEPMEVEVSQAADAAAAAASQAGPQLAPEPDAADAPLPGTSDSQHGSTPQQEAAQLGSSMTQQQPAAGTYAAQDISDGIAAAGGSSVAPPGSSAPHGGSEAPNGRAAAGGHSASDAGGAPDGGEPSEAEQRYQRAQRAVAALLARTPTPQQAQLALSSLQTVLQNALSSSDPKFRRVRQSNAVFQARLGRYPEALEVLHMAGFHEVADPEPALALKRDDPGLLWLTLAAVKDSLVH